MLREKFRLVRWLWMKVYCMKLLFQPETGKKCSMPELANRVIFLGLLAAGFSWTTAIAMEEVFMTNEERDIQRKLRVLLHA